MKEGTCVKCGTVGPIYAKGLCRTCYRKQLPPRKRDRKNTSPPEQKDFCRAKPPEQVELSFAPPPDEVPEKKDPGKKAAAKKELPVPENRLRVLCFDAAEAIVDRIKRDCKNGSAGDIKTLAEALGKVDDILYAVEESKRG
jgi:ribosomal protein L40E